MIPVLQCEDPASLQTDLQERQQILSDVRQKVSQTAIQPTPLGPP